MKLLKKAWGLSIYMHNLYLLSKNEHEILTHSNLHTQTICKYLIINNTNNWKLNVKLKSQYYWPVTQRLMEKPACMPVRCYNKEIDTVLTVWYCNRDITLFESQPATNYSDRSFHDFTVFPGELWDSIFKCHSLLLPNTYLLIRYEHTSILFDST